MARSLPLYIGLRYTRAKRRNQFISFVSGFSLLGMALGVAALIIVLSVMNGLDREMKDRILRVIPHGYILADKPLQDWQTLATDVAQTPRVLGAAPFVNGAGVLSLYRQNQWVKIHGVLPDAEQNVSLIAENMRLGKLEHLYPGEWGIVLGISLARFLGVGSIGDMVTLTTPQFDSTLLGPSPRTRRFRVVGVFEVGAQIDSNLALIHIDDAQKIYRLNGVQGLRVRVDDIYRAAAVMQSLQAQLPTGYTQQDWSQTQGNLFKAVKMEKIMVMLMLMIIIAIAAFNIITSLVLMVADKRSDIAVLRTLGMSTRQIMGVFMVQGSAVGIAGIVVGVLLGSVIAFYLADLVSFGETLFGVSVFDPTVYQIPTVPSRLQLTDIVTVVSCAVVMSVAATIYPALRASKIEPAEALRYE